MIKHWQNALIGFLSVLFFVILGFLGLYAPLENRLYDLYLRYRPQRERTPDIVFLDVDNEAIAVNGVFPWPRSVMADGLLRLKEYGARAVIFDIEYVDKGPQGVDTVSLEGLPSGFDETFSEIDGSASDMVGALLDGRFPAEEASGFFSGYLDGEKRNLLDRALSVARNNDEYLAQAFALNGNSWITLNLRMHPLEGEQASRLPIAEELFSYPVRILGDVDQDSFAGILPPIPSFARAAKGAGFTRAFVDGDGVRRRIDLAQEFNGRFYLQLAFSPLADYFGRPDIELDKKRLVMRNVSFPPGHRRAGETGDITIPLDGHGRMLLDWPVTRYEDSFNHFSFAALSRLEETQAEVERSLSILSSSENIFVFADYDSALAEVPAVLLGAGELLSGAAQKKEEALGETSDGAFEEYLSLRDEAWELLARFSELGFPEKIGAAGEELSGLYPEQAAFIREEAQYLGAAARNLSASFDNFNTLQDILKNALAGKFCLVGQTDAGTTDIGVNPFHNEYVNLGTQGVVLDTILAESFIVWLPAMWGVLVSLVTPLFLLVFAGLAPAARYTLVFFTVLLGILGSFLLFRFTGIFLSPLCPVLSLVAAVGFRELAAYAVSDREKQFIRKAFSTYVSGDVVKEIIADPSLLQLGGAKRHMSAIFTDIQGFTSISEQLDPEDLVTLLNRYLTSASDIILDEKGTIDKYEGDAIVAFFGAPLELPDHALRACLSAIAIKHAEAGLNRSLLEQNLIPSPLLTRIGISTGSMVAGNMGTENKMNYTIMGNTVNLASRLEGVNKQYGTWILVSGATLAETGDSLLSRRLDRVRVVGISEPAQLYELVETREAATDVQKETVFLFEKALALFEKRDWKNAAAAFSRVIRFNPNDQPSRIFLKRSKAYLVKPPSRGWDGVFNLDKK